MIKKNRTDEKAPNQHLKTTGINTYMFQSNPKEKYCYCQHNWWNEMRIGDLMILESGKELL